MKKPGIQIWIKTDLHLNGLKYVSNQASAFNGSCNIYAPEYRQATYYSFFDKDEMEEKPSI